jgi:hypothetical protein
VHNLGSLTFFHTLTTNPHWKEFKDLGEHKNVYDCPDDVARIFHIRLTKFKKHLDHLFPGRFKFYLSSNEWQQSGLPHVHIVDSRCDTLGQPFDIRHNPGLIDETLSAEIPSPDFPILRKLVSDGMIHEPCGPHGNENAACWNRLKKKCSEGFPKALTEETRLDLQTGFIIHRRRSQPDNVLRNWRTTHSKIIYAEIDNRCILL